MSANLSETKANLPRGWELVELQQIAEINPGLRISIDDENQPVNFVPMRAVEPEGAGLLRPEIRTYGEVRKGYTVFHSGDVIMAKITPCMENGKTTVVPELPDSICFGSTEFHVIRPEIGVDPRWISNFLLQHEVRRAARRSMAGGVGQMRVPGSFVSALNIPLPPRDEVQRIFAELDELLPDLDAAVVALESVQKKLPHYRAAVLKAAVTGKLSAEWRLRHPTVQPASELLDCILAERRVLWEEEQLRKFAEAGKEPPNSWRTKYREPIPPDISVLPSLPEGWCWATCDQLAWSSGYGTSQKCRKENVGLPVLRIPNIIGSKLDLTELKYASPDYSEKEEESVSRGDLLVIRTNGSRSLIGRGAMVLDSPQARFSFASYLIRLRFVPVTSLLNWISLLWDSSHVRVWIESHAATSAGQYNVNLTALHSLPMPLPPCSEQEMIVEAVEDQLSVVEHLKTDLEIRLQAAPGLRELVLRSGFAGQLVPQEPTDEPASELLRRIAAEREERACVEKAAKAARERWRPDTTEVGA